MQTQNSILIKRYSTTAQKSKCSFFFFVGDPRKISNDSCQDTPLFVQLFVILSSTMFFL